MTEHNKIIVFDFDGVVCESTDECMVTSWNAWEKWESRDSFRRTISEFSPQDCEQFRKVRPRVRGAGEYYILRRAFSENITIEDQDTYNQLEDRWHEYFTPFKAVFFEMRNRLRTEDLEQWIDLHPIYNDVIKVMKKLHAQDRLFMATLKDAESVRLILGKQGLVLPEERLLDQSQIKTKVEALNRFCEQLDCDKTNLIFIDDNITHLLEPKAAGYPVYLTTWGSTMDEYLQIAEQNQIPLLADCSHLLREV
jgi:phosphoglycolate phosphatase-like HAD superfamily hydrolase